jgi:general secretion pathway protein D
MKSRARVPAASGSVLSGAVFSIAIFAVLAVFGLSSVSLYAESASTFFTRGQRAEAREDYDAAFDNYRKASEKDPSDLRFRTAFYRVRVSDSASHMTKGRKLIQAGDEQGALAEFLHASEIDPGNEAAQQEITKIRLKHGESAPLAETSLPEAAGEQAEIDAMGPPAELKLLSNEPLTLHMSEDTKVVYQAIGRAAGINVLVDPDYTSKRIQVDLNSVSILDALRIVGSLSNTFWRPITANTIFVAQNSRAKRTELDEQAVQTFYLTNAWQQNDLNDVQTALRNVLPTAKVYGVASQNAIVMRGTPDELLLAQKLINDLDKARPEVVVDIAVLEVSKNWEKTLGIAWPSSASVALQTSTTSTTSSSSSSSTTTTPTLYDLAHLKASNFAVTIGAAQANILLTDGNTKILENPRIRCTDSQKATMKIGTRIPIATGSYSTGVASTAQAGMVNTQFQYIDVGVNIEMTPTVHFDHDVTLKIKIEDSSEDGNVTISGVTEPIIAQKTSEQVIRLREGEASVLSGMVNKTDIQSWNGVPGLSSIPGLKYLFGSKDHQIQQDEIVFLLVPHVVRSQDLDPINLRTIDTGTGQTIELRHLPSEVPAPTPAFSPAPPAAHPVAVIRPAVGTIPGQSAQAAAPMALAQIDSGAQGSGEFSANTSPPAGNASFAFTPPAAPPAVGSTFRIPVLLSGAKDIASVPLQIKYDPEKLSLVNVDYGDFLSRDGQAVALVHRDDGPGVITIDASRPPGVAGLSGAGVVCVLSFQARAAGESALTMTKAAAVNSAQQQVPAKGAQTTIVVR